jgi:hypothetical protein
LGASYPTTNFIVHAPSAQIAQQFGQAAEYYRKEKALQWLGQEMPPWPQRCPLTVTVTLKPPGGATQFHFENGRILGQQMNIEGPLDRLLASVLPHEVTHTVFAHYFRCPVPRWADEGGAVLSEDDPERARHDQLCRQLLNAGRAMQLRTLLSLRDYPRDVMCLYAQGFSLADYLVKTSNRQTYLQFVGHGMRHGWDSAVQTCYRLHSVEELEQAWLAHLRDTKRPPATLASNTRPAPVAPASQTVVRLTAPPVQPLDSSPPAPVYRGVAPSPGQEGERFGDAPGRAPTARPGYLPDALPPAGGRQTSASPTNWHRPQGQPPPPSYTPVQVQLGPPEFGPFPPDRRPAPGGVSPVGFPQ